MSASPYSHASQLLSQIIDEGRSLKSVVYSSSKLQCTKSTYAQVCETMKYMSLIESIIDHNNGNLRKSIEKEGIRQKSLLYILLHELLFSKYAKIRGGGKVKRSIMKFEKQLKETRDLILSQSKEKGGKDGKNVIIPPVFPRYVRVNTLKSTSEEVCNVLKDQIRSDENQGNSKELICADSHVPDLLVIKPNTSILPEWHKNELVTSGKIVLQDKSSCFSALTLVHGSNHTKHQFGDFIDACAAPGNKTSHLAALVHKAKGGDRHNVCSEKKERSRKKRKRETDSNSSSIRSADETSKIFAFDRSSSRISLLKKRLKELSPPGVLVDDDENDGNKNSDVSGLESSHVQVYPVHQDFLTTDPKDYPNVRGILLDPSCSGSGIVNTPDRFIEATQGSNDTDTTNSKQTKSRIESLRNFQLIALKHAMAFPQVQSIVYSTCSVHIEENEEVVAAALKEANQVISDNNKRWKLVSPVALHDWPRRGKIVDGLSKEEVKCLIRVSGLEDDTNGFFVSYFERGGRIGPSDEVSSVHLKNQKDQKDKITDKSARKKAKAKAWKRKQSELKKQRLLKKKQM